MCDKIVENKQVEILKLQLKVLSQENERIKAQNISLQQDLSKVIEAHNRAIDIINKYIERGENASVDRTRKPGSKFSHKRKKL